VTTIFFVEVLSTVDAQTLAIGFADRVDGNLQHGKFTQEFFHIEVSVFRQEQTRFRDRTLVKGIQLGKFPIEFLNEIRQAAHAIDCGFGGKIPLDDQSLRGLADIDISLKVAKFKFAVEVDLLEIERKVVVIADLFMNDEADVEAKGFFRVRHD